MSISEFTNKVFRILEDNFPDKEFVCHADDGVISLGDSRFGMSNLLAEYKQYPTDDADFAERIAENFRRVLELLEQGNEVLPHNWLDAKPRLRVQLVSGRIQDLDAAVKFPFTDDVFSSVVVDAPTGYAYVRNEDVQRWEQSVVDILEIAQQNLLAASENMQMFYVPGDAPFCSIQTGDGYDAARILVPEIRQVLIQRLTQGGGNEIYAAVPNRDFLISWPTTIPGDLHRSLVERVAMDAGSQPHPLTRCVLKVSEEAITPM